MSPIAAEERIELLDIVRGAALFGILASNMRAFNGPLDAYFNHALMWTGTVDRITQALVDFFITGKFITIFATLFGIGFAIQMDRAAARGADAKRFYRRRLGILLGFGLLHGVLLWWGDILAPYALMGFVMLGFRNSSQRKILRWAAIFYVWPVALIGLFTAISLSGVPIPPAPPTTQLELNRVIAAYSSGTFAQIVMENLKGLAFSAAGLIFFYPRALAMFLLGMWAYREGLVRNFWERRELLVQLRKWGLIVGVLGNGAMVAVELILHPNPTSVDLPAFLYNLAGEIGIPAMSLFYVSAIALAYPRIRERLRPFAAVGRMSLSNYLAQSLVCTTLYYSWGFGLYGRVSPLTGLAITIVVFSLQVAVSSWWLERHLTGPMERLWRRLAYGPQKPEATVASA